MAHTVIQVPVPALERIVRPHTRRSLPTVRLPESETVCAHITLLGPFVDRRDVNAELIDKIAALLANVTSFAFQLTDLAHFPDNLVHLIPHPSARFRELTALLAAAFPDWPPYGGAFTEIVPHLSIGKTVTGNEADDLRRRLPIDTTADQVTLTYWSDEEVEILETFPLSADLPA